MSNATAADGLAERLKAIDRILSGSAIVLSLEVEVPGAGDRWHSEGLLSFEDAEKLVRHGEVQFWAEKFEVTVFHMNRFVEFMGKVSERQAFCSGVNQQGKPCRTELSSYFQREVLPSLFEFGIDDRCKRHGGRKGGPIYTGSGGQGAE